MRLLIEKYLSYRMNEPMSDALRGLEEKLQLTFGDRRYKLHISAEGSNASETSWSAIVKFKGRKFYINITQPWTKCPLGKVEVESI